MSKKRRRPPVHSSAAKIENAIGPIERIDFLLEAAGECYRRREVHKDYANYVAIAFDMLEDEMVGLRMMLYGEDLAP